jgi:hypothetical protein
MINRVIIAGGREFNNYELLCNKCDYYLKNLNDVTIISGTARGVDKLGERYARERGYSLVRYPADWNLGKQAGHLRNKQMAENADYLIIFWDGVSKGSKNMIENAKNKNLKTKIVYYGNK